ncbi:hypothetical protein ASC75_13745 [Aminobacter sp. DSM 101952]|uniref:hypothetical protein n=1 Tax=Aminobacter sp. DSM 101952 TaxID=2735891 RepID=UPI0006F490A8|nr:hypothetical protein [Aminobacter sp. DSM 101952]KQU64212.1 hypothetical protein ASC75_13745 [Aminobacter sp. DSM 101952]
MNGFQSPGGCVQATGPSHLIGFKLTLVRLLLPILLALNMAGCAIQLAPMFDKTIVQGLTTANEQTMILFASVSSGSKAQSFGKRKPEYDSLIGQFDALRLQAKSRPSPPPPSLFLKTRSLASERAGQIDLLSQAPTIEATEQIVLLLTRMRDTDERRGLSTTSTGLFKNQFEILIRNALIYEKALER